MHSESPMMIKKHSAMIQTNAKQLTLIQRKLVNYMILIAQKAGKKDIYKTTIMDIKKTCNIGSTENVDVKEQFRKLADIKIEFNYLNKDKNEVWQIMALISSTEIVNNTGIVEFEFSSKLLEKILNPSIYAPLNITLVSGLKSSYSIILYELLRDYLNSPSVPVMVIENFRNLLGINENEYKYFKDFKKRVLDVAVKEVNEKTDICCRFELIKEKGIRNKYSQIRFFVSQKTGDIIYEKTEDAKKEKADFSMDLFENSAVQENKPAVQIPENIMSEIPDSKKTETIIEIITAFLEKGPDYIIPNIKYSLKKSKDNFPAYLKQSLEEDYAKHEREVENKKKEKIVLKVQETAQKQKSRVEGDEILENIKTLPKNAYNKLRKSAIKELEKIDPKNPFIKRDVVIESKMIELYEKSRSSEYSPSDRD